MTTLKIVIIVLLYSPLFSEAIFGGENVTDPHKYPWLTKLNIFDENGAAKGCGGSTRVSVQGVESLWGDCRFIPADWGSQ